MKRKFINKPGDSAMQNTLKFLDGQDSHGYNCCKLEKSGAFLRTEHSKDAYFASHLGLDFSHDKVWTSCIMHAGIFRTKRNANY